MPGGWPTPLVALGHGLMRAEVWEPGSLRLGGLWHRPGGDLPVQIGHSGEKGEARTHSGTLLSPLENGTVGRRGSLAAEKDYVGTFPNGV